jgi:hypothetical protein
MEKRERSRDYWEHKGLTKDREENFSCEKLKRKRRRRGEKRSGR